MGTISKISIYSYKVNWSDRIRRGGVWPILGPPGTGKTYTLMGVVEEALELGIAPHKIAFTSFTRAARLEMLHRCNAKWGYTPDDMPWVRTVHAIAYKLLGVERGQIFADKHWQEFGRVYGYQFSTDHAQDLDDGEERQSALRTPGDSMRAALEWGRLRQLAETSIPDHYQGGLHRLAFAEFAGRLRAYKADKRLLEFSDLLSRAIAEYDRAGLRPSVDLGIIDEAQDLSPLQTALVERWFNGCKSVFIAGDPDQAIYEYSGASPEWLTRLARAHDTHVLGKSYRVPRLPWLVAQSVIRRNRGRIETGYQPADKLGSVERMQWRQMINGVSGDTFILARNNYLLFDSAVALFKRGVPYRCERGRGPQPYDSKGKLAAVQCALDLAAGRGVTGNDLVALLRQIAPDDSQAPKGTKTKLRKIGSKKVDAADLDQLGLLTLLDRLSHGDPLAMLTGMDGRYRHYYQTVAKGGVLQSPQIVLTSMHGSKGREARTVVLMPDISRRTAQAYLTAGQGPHEAENRVHYVAATRSLDRLVICQPRFKRSYPYPGV